METIADVFQMFLDFSFKVYLLLVLLLLLL